MLENIEILYNINRTIKESLKIPRMDRKWSYSLDGRWKTIVEYTYLKGLSHEIDFKNVDNNLQDLA